jgi:hypothetical protein
MQAVVSSTTIAPTDLAPEDHKHAWLLLLLELGYSFVKELLADGSTRMSLVHNDGRAVPENHPAQIIIPPPIAQPTDS